MTRSSATSNSFLSISVTRFSHKRGAGRGPHTQSVRDVFRFATNSTAELNGNMDDLIWGRFGSEFPSQSLKRQVKAAKGTLYVTVLTKTHAQNKFQWHTKVSKGKNESFSQRDKVFYIKQKRHFPTTMSNVSMLQTQSFTLITQKWKSALSRVGPVMTFTHW